MSPALPEARTMEGFYSGVSVPVNEKLSEISLQLHISEKSGRGVPKIIEVYGKDAIAFHENTIVVTIPFERINATKEVGNKVGNRKFFLQGLDHVIERLKPSAIIVYGSASDAYFFKYKEMGIPIHQFDSDTSTYHSREVD